MDWLTQNRRIREIAKKYRYVLAALLVGTVLMVMPEESPKNQPEQTEKQTQPLLQEDLTRMLSQVAGAGKVEVLLTQSAGEQILYQTDEQSSSDESGSDVRRETILITNADRQQTGLVVQTLAPRYQGAIILCQGADNASVRLAMVQAVMSVTGLRSDKITVLKMK